MSEPNLIDKLKNLKETLVDALETYKSTGKLIAEGSIADQRLKICRECEFFLQNREVCGVCGCNMSFKTRLVAGRCPKQKW
jgi:hypothetical protein